MMTKLCKDCKWCGHKPATFWDKLFLRYVEPVRFAKCLHPKSFGLLKGVDNDYSFVDGVDRREATYCTVMRGGYSGLKICGPDAMLFEPKE